MKCSYPNFLDSYEVYLSVEDKVHLRIIDKKYKRIYETNFDTLIIKEIVKEMSVNCEEKRLVFLYNALQELFEKACRSGELIHKKDNIRLDFEYDTNPWIYYRITIDIPLVTIL